MVKCRAHAGLMHMNNYVVIGTLCNHIAIWKKSLRPQLIS